MKNGNPCDVMVMTSCTYRGPEQDNPGDAGQGEREAAQAAAVKAHDKEAEHHRDDERADPQCP